MLKKSFSSVFALLVASSSFSTGSSFADEVIVNPAPAAPLAENPKIKNWIYFGGDLGLMTLKPDSSLNEADKSGIQFNLKALYSRYFENWVLDLGLGYMVNNINGTQSSSTVNAVAGKVGDCFLGADCKTRTRAGFLEVSPRYRLSQNWQIGAVVNGFFGTDVSFDQTETNDTQSFALAVGPRLNYETDGEEGRWRFGGQLLTALNLTNRSALWLQADVQYGFPFGAGEEPYQPVAQTPLAPEPSPLPEALPAAPVREAPQFATEMGTGTVRIYLGEAVLRFKTSRSDLRPGSYEILDKVTKYLLKYPNAWEKLRVEGHTDRRGGLAYNERLSVNRAKSVGRQLQNLGIQRSKMVIRGFGPRKPVDRTDDMEAWAMNRRVEVWLDGVTDTTTVIRDLNELK
jgi:outer membrane protein OmpA-like peptidoglycan-associated protein